MTASPRERVFDLCARALVCALFTMLSIRLLADFLHTGRVTGLLLLASESLVVVLTLLRRRAQFVDRSAVAAAVTIISIAAIPLLRPVSALSPVADTVTAIISALGLALVVLGKITLGRSFGLVPANRGVVVRGPYTFVRHPIYTGYLVTHVAFVVAHPSPWNVIVLVVGDTALIVRALMEERALSADAAYQGYCQRVGWHLVPGVF
jgi:protein-S-isoprenylcysteine O-methyltransferase Ste14